MEFSSYLNSHQEEKQKESSWVARPFKISSFILNGGRLAFVIDKIGTLTMYGFNCSVNSNVKQSFCNIPVDTIQNLL